MQSAVDPPAQVSWYAGLWSCQLQQYTDYTMLLPLIPPWVKTTGDTAAQGENHPLVRLQMGLGTLRDTIQTQRGECHCVTNREGWTEENSVVILVSPGAGACFAYPCRATCLEAAHILPGFRWAARAALRSAPRAGGVVLLLASCACTTPLLCIPTLSLHKRRRW